MTYSTDVKAARQRNGECTCPYMVLVMKLFVFHLVFIVFVIIF
jgi:hypothetical protein